MQKNPKTIKNNDILKSRINVKLFTFFFEKKERTLYNYIIGDVSVHCHRSHLIFVAFNVFPIYHLDSGKFVSYCVDFNCPQIYKLAMSLSSKWDCFLVMADRGEKKDKQLSSGHCRQERALYYTYVYIRRPLPNRDEFGLRITTLLPFKNTTAHFQVSYRTICPLFIVPQFEFSKNRSCYFKAMLKISKTDFFNRIIMNSCCLIWVTIN